MSVKAVVKINNVDVSSYVYSTSLIQIVNRNRDYSPVFQGMRLSLSSNIPNTPAKHQEVLVTVNDVQDVFLGVIKDIRFNQTLSLWELEIDHFLLNLEKIKIDSSINFAEDTADFGSEKEFTVDTTNNYLICTDHGLLDGDRIQVISSGTLPAPLAANHNYYVKKIDDNNVRLYNNQGHYAIDAAYGSFVNYINITSSGSGTHSFTDEIDLFKYNDWSVFNDIIAFSFNTETDEILTAASPVNDTRYNKYKFPIDGYQTSPTDFSVVRFEPLPGFTFPFASELEGRFFISAWFHEDEGWVIYPDSTDYGNNVRANFTTGGRARFAKVAQYRGGENNLYYKTAIVSVKWLVISLFRKINIELDTTEIDEIIFHKFVIDSVEYNWTWDKIYLMESMLHNIYSGQVSNISEIENSSTRINAMELIQDIFMRFGIIIKTADTVGSPYHYKLYSQKRDSNGLIRPENEDLWEIDERYIDDYYEKDLLDTQTGYHHERRMIAMNTFRNLGDTFIFDPMSFRYNDEKESIWYEGGLSSRNYIEANNAFTQIDWPDNLRFFLLDQASGKPKVIIPDAEGSPGKEFYHITNYSAIQNQIYALLNHKHLEISFRLGLFDQEIYTVKEIWLDIKKDLIIVIQEINLLESG